MSFSDLVNDIKNISSKEKIIILSSVLLLLLLPFVVFVSTSSQKQEIRSQAAETSIDSINTQILQNNTSGNIAVNRFLLEQRRVIMTSLAYDNPQEFLNKVMTADLRNSFSESQRFLIEEKVDLTGTLVPYHTDNFETKTAKTGYFIQTGDSTISISFDSLPSEESLELIHKVSIRGYKIDNLLVAKNKDLISLEASQEQSTSIAKEKKLIVFPINFSDDRSRPYAITDIDSKLFGSNNSLKKYFMDVSDKKLNISGVVMNWVELSMKGKEICTNQGLARALFIGLEKVAYLGIPFDSIVFVFPSQGCGWGGMGSIGGNPGQVFIQDFSVRTLVHELGHNLGVNHANLFHCTPYGCGDEEYGDKADPMGFNLAGMNGSHLLALNFKQNSRVTSFTTDRIFTLYKQGSAFSPQAIKFDMPNDDQDIYVEYRGGKTGYDENVPYSLGAGVLIYKWNGNSSSKTKLIDITPSDKNPDNLVIKDGEKVRLSKITVRQISHNDNLAKIEIKRY